MRAKVSEIISAGRFTDGYARIQLDFMEADIFYKRLQVKHSTLGLSKPLALDDEVEVVLIPVPKMEAIPIDAPLAQTIRHDQMIDDANAALADAEQESL